MNPLPRIETPRTIIKLLDPDCAPLMTNYRVENREHLTQWEPSRSGRFYTDEFWRIQLRSAIREYRHGLSTCLVITNKDEDEVIGVCNYTNIIRGTFEACHLGYGISQRHEGKGLMYEALAHSTEFVFKEVGLHRIMANYIPRNEKSGALLKRLGFEIEGQAKRYLKINGVWEDHVLTSLLKPETPE